MGGDWRCAGPYPGGAARVGGATGIPARMPWPAEGRPRTAIHDTHEPGSRTEKDTMIGHDAPTDHLTTAPTTAVA